MASISSLSPNIKFIPKQQQNITPAHSYSNQLLLRILHTRSGSVKITNNQRRTQALRNVTVGAKGGSEGRILWSDVVVRPKEVFRGRKWNVMDIVTASVMALMHLLCVFAPGTLSWGCLWLVFGLWIATGLFGITLSFHRNLTHKSFKLPKWAEYTFAYCGVQAIQGNPIDWVSTHRYHHQYCDTDKDPHSPTEGFWYSHMNWLFDTDNITKRCGEPNNVADLEKQPFYRFLRTTYIVHPIAFSILLYALGGFPFIVWGMGVRIVWVYHITWLVNSACHIWGQQAWNTGDLSRNNWWVGILAFGEGWHNNHHAFEYSARHGLEWWQIDMTRRAPNEVEPEIRTLVEVAPMADNRTMEELLQAPTEGYGEAIVIPKINVDHFEIKTNLLQLVQANPYHGFERENPHTHINNFKRITSTLKFRDVLNDVIKLMMFPYSLEGAARVWYDKEPPNSILTGTIS
nr:palmitoyl-monogalactosyldiacylglycerol delta-7 desaturase, chloroplastic [Tanacetum cinerariifolium]